MAKRVLVYLDTDKFANPFDLILALDAGFDSVLPYAGVTPDNCASIIQNATFPRSPEENKSTVVYIGGKVTEAEKLFHQVQQVMRTSGKLSTIFDPSGACTTAAAAVAKIEKLAGGLRGKKVTVLAGTGPIGQICAILFRNLGAQVTITSRTKEKATKVANKLSDDVRGKVIGMQASTNDARAKACEGADVVMATGMLAVQLLDSASLKKVAPKVAADVNVVAPYGIEDAEPELSGDEKNGIKLLGGIDIGVLKNNVEKELLRRATEDVKFYDYNDALIVARELL